MSGVSAEQAAATCGVDGEADGDYGKASGIDVYDPDRITVASDGGAYGVDGMGQPFDFARERVRRKRLQLRKISNRDKRPSISIVPK